MSLSRILNDEPALVHPARNQYASPSPPTLGEHPASAPPASPPHSQPLPSSRYSHPLDPPQKVFQVNSYDVPAQGTSHSAKSGEWANSLSLSSNEPVRDSLAQVHEQATPMEESSSANHFHAPENEPVVKKRRKGANEDLNYNPRRVGQRKSSRRTKQNSGPSPPEEIPDVEQTVAQQKASDEDPRFVSSDLEDCEEIWLGELGDYILETKKRQNQVAKWFQASILERNSLAAQDISHHYAARIANIPLSPPPQIPQHIEQRMEADTIFAVQPPTVNDDTDYSSRFVDSSQHNVSAEDVAKEFERSILDEPTIAAPSKRNRKGKDSFKRPAQGFTSDGGSDQETRSNDAGAPALKKRKLENDAASIADDVERSIVDDVASMDSKLLSSTAVKGKGKGKQVRREPSHDSASMTPMPVRKKPGPKKKFGLAAEIENEAGMASQAPSVADDVTPAASRPTSPSSANATMIYELDEFVPSLKKAKKVDDGAMLKRIKGLEEAQKKVWTNIARRDVAKVYKYQTLGYQTKQSLLERMAKLASIHSRKPFTKTAKANKDMQAKAKRLMREMQVFWKKNEKEERDVRKREHKEAMDRLKLEEEKREAARQARKLEFLISQTELYSHFVGSKLKTTEIEGDGQDLPAPEGASVTDVDPASLPEIDFDDADHTNLHRHARYNAQEAIARAREQAQQFDNQTSLDRKTSEAMKLAKAQAHIHDDPEDNVSGKAPLVDLDSDELNFQNPTSLSGQLTIAQPKMLMAQLKEYQLKGLNWLGTLYEQGINGILADEMGLGKTVQSISLLAHLAETHDIWGPFLVVAPASTLHNWQQELTRFVPKLKALPYWGNVKDRATLRKFWSKKEISYNEDAPFHVLITSYQLITQDQQYFQRVKWQYMILDEAQNIKNSSSVRWKTLLGFQCRNRLLLTGTPIQNSMQELWALLHFIMPSLFDSHDEFNEWFSKDIENAAENKGSKLNEHQLRRLHMILKPFMLRRVKRHVQNELSEKIEKDIYVDMSPRQRSLYQALIAKVSVADLLEKAANIGDADSARSLMNLVMQFRKVCNHPELFERADVVAPFSFSVFGRPGSLMREGDFVLLPYSSRNPIEISIPDLLYRDGGLLAVPCENSLATSFSSCVTKLFNIWSTDWMHKSIYEENTFSFSFLRFLDLGPSEAHILHISPLIRRTLCSLGEEAVASVTNPYSSDPTFAAYMPAHHFTVHPRPSLNCLDFAEDLPRLREISLASWNESCLSRPELRWFVPPALAPPISLHCSDRCFMEAQTRLNEAPIESLALYGLPPQLRDSEDACATYQSLTSGLSPVGLFNNSPTDQIPMSPMQVPEAKRLIYDSAKLARLDSLLQELKAGDHRVLVYFQMTRMMDLMEEYLIYRQYRYLRLDGSSKLEDRRDMVIDWQTRPDIFVFLLSTRAGGLGINLTAADTVVFYDHDWNPSNDAQAMDRAHRLGQTRQVTVYRLITRGTIDERIVQLARVKKDVQDIVVGNKNFTDVTKPSEIVQLLLNDEQLASLESSSASGLAGTTEKQGDSTSEFAPPARDLWDEEGDDFFGHSAGASSSATIEIPGTDNVLAPSYSARGKKRKPGATGAPRGRKPGVKRKTEMSTLPGEMT